MMYWRNNQIFTPFIRYHHKYLLPTSQLTFRLERWDSRRKGTKDADTYILVLDRHICGKSPFN
ncbi:hypothetical protein D3C87_311200 [compost metagenome]